MFFLSLGVIIHVMKANPSEAARALGSIKTAKKSASSRQNIAGANPLKALSEIPCNCEGGASTRRNDHRGTCPKYRAIRYREMRGLTLRETESNGAAREYSQREVVNPLRDALALREELAPIIRAGTHNGGAPFDAAADVRAMREERFADV